VQQADPEAGTGAFNLLQRLLLLGIEWNFLDETPGARRGPNRIARYPSGAAEFSQGFSRKRLCASNTIRRNRTAAAFGAICALPLRARAIFPTPRARPR